MRNRSGPNTGWQSLADRQSAALVVNDAAGGLSGKPGAAEAIIRSLSEFHPSLQVLDSKDGTIEERLDAAMRSGCELIYVAGGDGTISAAAQKLVGTRIALGVLPLGTMNLVAKDLNIPLDIDAAVGALAAGIRQQIDVGKVGDAVFLCNSVIGVAPLLARHRERERNQTKSSVIRWFRVAMATLKSLRYRSRRLKVSYDGTARNLRTKALTISVNAYDEGSATLLKRSILDGGELAVYIAPDVGSLKLLGGFLRFLSGKGAAAAGLDCHRVKSIRVSSRHVSLTVMNDGEPVLMPVPLSYRILPRALTVIVPRVAAADARASEAHAIP